MSRSESSPSTRRAVVIVYATCVLALLGVLSLLLLDSADSALDANFSLVSTQLARYAADSGLEYAIAAVDAELSNNANGFRGPWQTVDYSPPAYVGWMDPAGTEEAGGTKNHVHNLTPASVALHGAKWDLPAGPTLGASGNDVEVVASRFQLSFFISMMSSLNPLNDPADRALSYQNTFNRVMSNQNAVFAIRSRGICRSGKDPQPANPSTLLVGYATAVAVVRIGSLRPNGMPRIERLTYELLPGNTPAFSRGPTAQWDQPFPALALAH